MNINERRQQLKDRAEAKVAQFSVGDEIKFELYDDSHCGEGTSGDPETIEMTGKILSINGHHATVEHKWGIAHVWLVIAEKRSKQ